MGRVPAGAKSSALYKTRMAIRTSCVGPGATVSTGRPIDGLVRPTKRLASLQPHSLGDKRFGGLVQGHRASESSRTAAHRVYRSPLSRICSRAAGSPRRLEWLAHAGGSRQNSRSPRHRARLLVDGSGRPRPTGNSVHGETPRTAWKRVHGSETSETHRRGSPADGSHARTDGRPAEANPRATYRLRAQLSSRLPQASLFATF